jgi:hypothetical protein
MIMPPKNLSHSNNNDPAFWTFGGWRTPKPLEARNINIDEIYPSEYPGNPSCGWSKKRLLLIIAGVSVIVVAVILGVVLPNGSGNEPSPELPTSSPFAAAPSPVTQQPTDSPSDPATFLPTLEPTTPTTSNPTAAPTPVGIAERFIQGLPPYSRDLAVANTDSPQGKALAWLQNDPLYYQYPSVHRLNQRYAMAVLYYSTNGPLWNNSAGWLSNTSECTWHTNYAGDRNVCEDDSRLVRFWMGLNNLRGSMPTELELLTDVAQLNFMDVELSVAIYPQ